jgi:hypothetical protein
MRFIVVPLVEFFDWLMALLLMPINTPGGRGFFQKVEKLSQPLEIFHDVGDVIVAEI